MKHKNPFQIEFDRNRHEFILSYNNAAIFQNCSLNLILNDGEKIISTSQMNNADLRLDFIEETTLEYSTEAEKCYETIFEFELNNSDLKGNLGLHFQVFPELSALRVYAIMPDLSFNFGRLTGLISFEFQEFSEIRYFSLFRGDKKTKKSENKEDNKDKNKKSAEFNTDHKFQQCWLIPKFLKSTEPKEISSFEAIPFFSLKKLDFSVVNFALNGNGQRSLFKFDNTISATSSGTYTMQCISGSYVKDFPARVIPGFLISISNDVNEAYENAINLASILSDRSYILRKNKKRPDWYEYLGWCTWNAFYRAVHPEFIEDFFEWMAEHDFLRIKYLILDDGWQDCDVKKKLISLYPNDKFPQMREFISHIKSDYGIKWFGVWHAFYGYWDGVDENSKNLKDFRKYFMKSHNTIPDPRKLGGYTFWINYYKNMKKWGVDFTKVDNQYSVASNLLDFYPIDYGAQANHLMIEGSAYQFGMDIINCMAMNPESYFNWNNSCVSRVSDDYTPGNLKQTKLQLRELAYNTVVFRNFTWPDFDMFYTFEEKTIYPLIFMHIVGGSPIYFADDPEETNLEILYKLCYNDGRIPLPDEPGWMPDAFYYLDTKKDEPLIVENIEYIDGIGPVNMFGIFNAAELENQINKSIKLTELGFDPDEDLLLYMRKNGEQPQIQSIKGDHTLELYLDEWDAYFLLIIPKDHSITPIGLDIIINGIRSVKKFLQLNETEWEILMEDSGILRIWHEMDEKSLENIQIFGIGSDNFTQGIEFKKTEKKSLELLEEGEYFLDEHFIVINTPLTRLKIKI